MADLEQNIGMVGKPNYKKKENKLRTTLVLLLYPIITSQKCISAGTCRSEVHASDRAHTNTCERMQYTHACTQSYFDTHITSTATIGG